MACGLLEPYLYPWDFYPVYSLCKLVCTLLYPSSPPVYHNAVFIHRCKIGSEGDLPWIYIHASPRCFEGASTCVGGKRVVAKDSEVSRVRAWPDAGRYGVDDSRYAC